MNGGSSDEKPKTFKVKIGAVSKREISTKFEDASKKVGTLYPKGSKGRRL